jgi:FO synthase
MDETITRSAGATHGQEMTPVAMESIIRSIGRVPRQRSTLYADVPEERYRASFKPRRDAPTAPAMAPTAAAEMGPP